MHTSIKAPTDAFFCNHLNVKSSKWILAGVDFNVLVSYFSCVLGEKIVLHFQMINTTWHWSFFTTKSDMLLYHVTTSAKLNYEHGVTEFEPPSQLCLFRTMT